MVFFSSMAFFYSKQNFFIQNKLHSSLAAAPKFSFGNFAALNTAKPVENTAVNTSAVKPAGKGFGDQFKPKPGSWSCKACYTQNTADSVYCACCEEPKDDTIPKKEKENIFASSNGKELLFPIVF